MRAAIPPRHSPSRPPLIGGAIGTAGGKGLASKQTDHPSHSNDIVKAT